MKCMAHVNSMDQAVSTLATDVDGFGISTVIFIQDLCLALIESYTTSADDWDWNHAHWYWLYRSNLNSAQIESINNFPTVGQDKPRR